MSQPLPPYSPRSTRASFVLWSFGIVLASLIAITSFWVGLSISRQFTSTTSQSNIESGTPIQTPTIGQPSVLTGATEGGTQVAFVSRYGPADKSGNGGASWSNATIAGQAVSFSITTDVGKDGKQHIVSIQAGPVGIGATWDAATAFAVMGVFYPRDSKFVRDDASNSNFNTRIYKSQQLAATLPIGQFVNGNNASVPVGEFNVACALNSGRQVRVCFLLPGEP